MNKNERRRMDVRKQLRLCLASATECGLLNELQDDCKSPESITDFCRAVAVADPAKNAALREFISCIESTGGVRTSEDGWVVPVADEDWSDLGAAYLSACAAMSVKPKYEGVS